VRYREVTRKLRRLGCEFHHHGSGDHEMWVNRQNQRAAPIPNWGSRDLKPGTIASILRQLGISRADFDQA
jgi:predicted RNA binding protein YcfA (HicA-like mRNA interferase family)